MGLLSAAMNPQVLPQPMGGGRPPLTPQMDPRTPGFGPGAPQSGGMLGAWANNPQFQQYLQAMMHKAMDEVLVEAAASMMRHKLARLARRKPKVFALVSIGYGWILEMEEQSDDKQRDAENEVPGGTLV
jgi:hypothetical protein